MKSKEEIEQLADDYANNKSSSDVFKDAHKNDFIQGYTQCQEDMADKKYTEEDIRKAVRIFFPLSVDDIVKLDKYINSLNKQD